MLNVNDIKNTLNKTVGVSVNIRGKWLDYTVTLDQLLVKLDSEARSLYKCYTDSSLTKSQRQAIRAAYKGLSVRPRQYALDLIQYFIVTETSFLQFDVQYLTWLYKLCKKESGLYDIPADAAFWKVEGFRQKEDDLTDNQLVNAALYQLVCTVLSDTVSLTLGAHVDPKDVFRTNDTECSTFNDWVAFFKSLPGYDKWEEELLSRTGSRMKVWLRTDSPVNGQYLISRMYFK